LRKHNFIELQNLQKPYENTQLWTPPFSFGLHPCVKPTPKYKGMPKKLTSNFWWIYLGFCLWIQNCAFDWFQVRFLQNFQNQIII